MNDLNATAIKIAGRMRKEIEKKEFEGRVIRLTSSFGVYTIDGDRNFLSIENLIKCVDDKLYQAKMEGRNKVV